MRGHGGAVERRHQVEPGWVIRAIGLTFLILVLVVLTVIDVDGDPATTNLPSVVLAASSNAKAETRPGIRRSRSPVTAGLAVFSRVRRRFVNPNK